MKAIINTVLALTLGLSIAGAARAPRSSTSAETQSQGSVRTAHRDDGLKGAARAAGGHFVHMSSWEPHATFRDLGQLVQISEVIVLGEITQSASHLSKSGEYITTDYKLHVRETLKGSIPIGSEIVFGVMGGKVVFDDGTSALIETKGFIRPNNGARIVVFLESSPNHSLYMPISLLTYANGSPIFNVVGWSRGIFELPLNEDDKVRLKAISAKDKLANDTRNVSVRKFLDDVRKAVEKDRISVPFFFR